MVPDSSYRYSMENLALLVTTGGLLTAIVVTGVVSICIAPVIILLVFILAYLVNRSHHQALLNGAKMVNRQEFPALSWNFDVCKKLFNLKDVDVFIVPSSERNAYTFGIDKQAIVVYSSLLKLMDDDEMRFVLGHESGHIALNHTFLNTITGGMAGIPQPFGLAVILNLIFQWWSRCCEYSCDRAGLIACGKLEKSISALVKLSAGNIRSQQQFDRAFQAIDAEDDSLAGQALEAFASHPMIIRRINELKNYANSAEYKKIVAARPVSG